MIIKIECEKCGKRVLASSSKMSSAGGDPTTVVLRIDHDCNPTELSCSLSTAMDELQNERVEVAYYKKNGDLRTLTGFFPLSAESKVGYVYFIEEVGGSQHFKYLIRTGITSIIRLSDDFMFIV